MYPVAFHSAQRTIQVWATVGVVVFGSMSFVVGTAILSGSAPPAALRAYNVTFANFTDSLTGASGQAPQRATTEVEVTVTGSNITYVIFSITYVDNTVSPLFNPAVTATITGPNGTGSATGSVPAGGADFTVAVPNEKPANQTVEAASEAEALAEAAGNLTDPDLGTGRWTVSLDVGSPLGGLLRPGATITYSIDLAVWFFSGSAKPA